jgi:hypothetical protein
MSENRRKCSTGCQIGPSVKVNPEPSWPTGAKGVDQGLEFRLENGVGHGKAPFEFKRHCERQ